MHVVPPQSPQRRASRLRLLTAGLALISALYASAAVQAGPPAAQPSTARSAHDQDGDGLPDAIDNCPTVVNVDQRDLDHDGIGDLCDADRDGDGILNVFDNCPTIANADQIDHDEDGIGDHCQHLVTAEAR